MDPGPAVDPDSREWIDALRAPGPEGEKARARLHEVLLAAAAGEALRRSARARPDAGRDGLAGQAADAALRRINAELDSYRGDSSFPLWAGKFVMHAMTAIAGRRYWHARTWPAEHEDWDRLLAPPAPPGAGAGKALSRRFAGAPIRTSPPSSARYSPPSCSLTCRPKH